MFSKVGLTNNNSVSLVSPLQRGSFAFSPPIFCYILIMERFSFSPVLDFCFPSSFLKIPYWSCVKTHQRSEFDPRTVVRHFPCVRPHLVLFAHIRTEVAYGSVPTDFRKTAGNASISGVWRVNKVVRCLRSPSQQWESVQGRWVRRRLIF